MDFIYDESGRPFALKYSSNNGATTYTYYYVLNLQGDVIKLIAVNGTTVAEYSYNAWGEIISSSGTMADINPLRYRGYYYDTETGFYYLQSRYYDPVTHRFINADSYASTGQGVIGHNMFAYCLNNPTDSIDASGMAGERGAATKTKSAAQSPSASLYGVAGALILGTLLGTAISEALNDNDISLEKLFRLQGKTHLLEQDAHELSKIARRYGLLKCKEAAMAMAKAAKYQGNIVMLEFRKSRRGYIGCDKYPRNAISENGMHYGFLYQSVVYCNVYPEGLPFDMWIRSFYTAEDLNPYYYIDGICLGQVYP